MRFNLKFLSSVVFAVTFLVGGFFVANTANAEATLVLTVPAAKTITRSALVSTTGTQSEINTAVAAAVSGLTEIPVTLANTGDADSANVRINPISAGAHIQLWAKDTSGNWFDINVTGWIGSAGKSILAGSSITTDVYAISDTTGDYPLTVNLVYVAGGPAADASGTVTVAPIIYNFKAFDGVDIETNSYTLSSDITATYINGTGTENDPAKLTLTGYAPIVTPWFGPGWTTYNYVTIGIKLPAGFARTPSVYQTGIMRYDVNPAGAYKMSTIGDGKTPLATAGAALGYLDYSFAANSTNTKKDGLVKLEVIWNVGDAPEYFTIDINGLQAGPVFIDADKDGNFDSGERSFNTIQAAITAATSGDTIHVDAGTYTEVGQIVINKNLSIVGANKTTTIIKPAQNTTNSGDGRGWFMVNSGVEFNLSNVTLDGSGKLVVQAIRLFGSGTIDNNIIKNIYYEKWTGIGVVVAGNNIIVSHNTLNNIERVGIIANGSGVTNAVIDGNTYTGKGDGVWLNYGIEVGNGAVATLTGNTITNFLGVADDSAHSTSAAIAVSVGSTAIITGNNILTGNYTGILVGHGESDTSTMIAHENNLSGNAVTGITSTSTNVVNATNNWWGSATGPADVGPGTGDKVSTNVNFTPWCTDLACTTFSSAKDITAFSFPQGTGVITGTNIAVSVPFGTSVTALVPTITLSAGATVSPSGAQNFTSPVIYTVTSADDTTSTQAYTVTVIIAPADTYTLTFISDGSPVSDMTAVYGSTLTAPIAPTKDGYTFSAWSPAFPATMPLGGATLTATWTAVAHGSSGSRPATPAVPANVTTPDGCAAGDKFSTTTGRNCNAATPAVPAGQVLGASTGPIPGCGNRTTGFSVTTGESCVGNSAGQVLGAEKFNFTKFLKFKAGSYKVSLQGAEVMELQKFLATLGYDLGIADGKFGPKTEGAVIKFQIANNLKGDGIVGALTRAVLNK